MASKRPLTAEQIAISEARKAKRAQQSAVIPTTASLVDEEKGHIVERKWISMTNTADITIGHRVKILTWNVCWFPFYHQTLEIDSFEYYLSCLLSALSVCHSILWTITPLTTNLIQGRELFPNSNCLKAVQREHMLYREILLQKADILCLQVYMIFLSIHSTHITPRK